MPPCEQGRSGLLLLPSSTWLSTLAWTTLIPAAPHDLPEKVQCSVTWPVVGGTSMGKVCFPPPRTWMVCVVW